MNSYKKITCWENKRRLAKLKKFHRHIIMYFTNSRSARIGDTRIEEEAAKQTRYEINIMSSEIHKIILASAISPSLYYAPPPAVGGVRGNIDLINNLFMLDRFGIPYSHVIDTIERSIGVYETDRRSSILRTLNLFWWINLALQWFAYMPFGLIGAAGFDAARAENSIWGRLIKFFIMSISTIASILAIFNYMGWLDRVKLLLGIGS